MKQLGLREERLLRGRAAGEAAGRQHICWCMDASRRQYGVEQQQRAAAGLIVANEIDPVDHGVEGVDVVEVYLDQDISVLVWCVNIGRDKD